MKTALESLDALEPLARKIASIRDGTTGPVYSDRDGIAAEWEADAVAIVSELSEPVDPIADLIRRLESASMSEPSLTSYPPQKTKAAKLYDEAASALRRAREEGVR